ncbi:MAG: hypothetical protein U0892_00180 [Pirellulales bacterium]
MRDQSCEMVSKMSLRLVPVFIVMCFVLSSDLFAREPEPDAKDEAPKTGKEYIDNYLLDVARFPKRAQFWVKHRTLISDVDALYIAATVDKTYRVSSMPSKAVAQKIEYRVEGHRSQLGDSSNVRTYCFFGELGDRRLYQRTDRLPLAVNKLTTVARDEQITPEFNYFNPPLIAAATYTRYYTGQTNGALDYVASCRILSERLNNNGKMSIVASLQGGLRTAEFTFSTAPPYTLESYKLFTDPNPNAPPRDDRTYEDVKHWKHFATTTTTWRDFNGIQVPDRVVMFTKRFSYEEYDCDIRFHGWKFDEEVDEVLFDPEQLARTTEDVDYETIDLEFDDLDAQYAKSMKRPIGVNK